MVGWGRERGLGKRQKPRMPPFRSPVLAASIALQRMAQPCAALRPRPLSRPTEPRPLPPDAHTLLAGAIMLVLWFGARLVLEERLSAGRLSAFVVYAVFVATNAGMLLGVFSQVMQVRQVGHLRVCLSICS